jgi:hypothetical protein
MGYGFMFLPDLSDGSDKESESKEQLGMGLVEIDKPNAAILKQFTLFDPNLI